MMARYTLTDKERDALVRKFDSLGGDLTKVLERIARLEEEFPYLRTFVTFTAIPDCIREAQRYVDQWPEYIEIATDEPWKEPTPPNRVA